ncbi:Craniofacial development protein 2, partial [Harpegnathos saltator]
RHGKETRTTEKKKKTGSKMKIGTWNIQTMMQPGRMMEVAGELKKFNFELIALQKLRWKGNSKIDKKEFTLYYSGSEERSGLYGTGFMVSVNLRRSVINFIPLGERLNKIVLKGKFRNIIIFSALAPTEEKTEEEKFEFYDKLEKECNKVPKYHMIVILGDFNAKIGKEQETSIVAGKHSLHDETSDNGKMLINLASTNMLIMSTFFEHKDIHKHTWKIPGSVSCNQIDHVLTNRQHFNK